MSEKEEVRRATTVDELASLMEPMVTPEGIGRGLQFVPRPSDVIIAPYGKSGTTWLQQIVHGLRTRGDMDYDDISRVVPWLETSTDLGLDLDAEQKADPRAFKSHLSHDLVPKGARYIVSVRDPGDALVSLYRFFENWWFEAGSISLEEFARNRFFLRGRASAEGGDYWKHFNSWWSVRDDPNVLLLAFENMKQDLPVTIRQVAEFLEIPLDPELEEIVTRQASFGFMLEHKDRFDDRLMRQHAERVVGLPAGADSSKVRAGKVGSRVELSDELAGELDEIWRETVTPTHGLRSYADALSQIA